MWRGRSHAGEYARERGDAGFVLAEVLVALVVLAVAVVLTHSVFASGWRAQHRVDGESTAVAIARAHLAAAGVETPLREGSFSGTEGGHDWRLVITPYDAPIMSAGTGFELGAAPPRAGRSRLSAWWVTVEVTFGDHTSATPRTIRLTTLKLPGGAP